MLVTHIKYGSVFQIISRTTALAAFYKIVGIFSFNVMHTRQTACYRLFYSSTLKFIQKNISTYDIYFTHTSILQFIQHNRSVSRSQYITNHHDKGEVCDDFILTELQVNGD